MVAGIESGDSHVVRQLPEGVLAAVIDGVGHGNEAADAARIAGRTLNSSPHEDAVSLVWRCHEALKETRGGKGVNLPATSPSMSGLFTVFPSIFMTSIPSGATWPTTRNWRS